MNRSVTEKQLLGIKGIGPLDRLVRRDARPGDPDAFLPSDLRVHRVGEKLGGRDDPASIAKTGEGWRLRRAYATQHLWTSLDNASTKKGKVA